MPVKFATIHSRSRRPSQLIETTAQVFLVQQPIQVAKPGLPVASCPLRYSPHCGLHVDSRHSFLHHVSGAGCAILSLPSPCDRLSRLRVLWSDQTPMPSSVGLMAIEPSYPARRGTTWVSQVLVRLSPCVPCSIDPGRVTGASPNRLLVVGFR